MITQSQNTASPTTPGITGYRSLTQTEKDLMNEIKAMGEQVAALVSRVREMQMREIAAFHVASATEDERIEFNRKLEQGQHWRSRAVDDLQAGFMMLTRSVARPTTFA